MSKIGMWVDNEWEYKGSSGRWNCLNVKCCSYKIYALSITNTIQKWREYVIFRRQIEGSLVY